MGKILFKQEWLLLVLLLLITAALYGPVVGKGFIKDDFIWIDSVVKNNQADISSPFRETTGFFRPIVGITFALQYDLSGLNPLPYGLFNLLLHMMNIILVYILFKLSVKTSDYALIIAALFALNSKANRMAVGWISGRTALLYSFFLLLSFIFLIIALKKYEGSNSLRRISLSQIMLMTAAVLSYLCAVLSKESAIAAPILVFLGTFFLMEKFSNKKRFQISAVTAALYIPALMVYFYFRSLSNAFAPSNAPDYYRFILDPFFIIGNFFEYFVRAGLFDIVILAVLLIFFFALMKKKKIDFSTNEFYILSGGLIIYSVFILIYLPIPHRSDLYAYFTQIGLHLAVAVVIYKLIFYLTVLKKPVKIFLTLFFCGIFIGWIFYIHEKNNSIYERGTASQTFSESIYNETVVLPDKSFVIILDKNCDSSSNPFNTVSYGFNSMLRLYHPLKNLNGKIVRSYEDLAEENSTLHKIFIWEHGMLKKKK